MESTSPPADGVRTLVSVHDLMPETLPAVRRTLALLERYRVAPVTLLVVPGAGWDAKGVAELRAFRDAGYRLAGHGWQHRVERIDRPYHRLHSLLFSRDVAEHLALDAGGILDLMRRCRDWLDEQGLGAPDLYVPPAWAMGGIDRWRLIAEGPFRRYEFLGGVLDAGDGRWHRTPMLGYEADRASRVPLIRAWNALNRALVRRSGLLRIGIHPFDMDLRLREDMERDLAQVARAIDYAALAERPALTAV